MSKPRKEVNAIMQASVAEFKGSGFIIIKTDIVNGKTNIDWISNLDNEDTIDLLRSTALMG